MIPTVHIADVSGITMVEPEDVQPWRPIETAPRDSMDMLLLFRPDAPAWAKVAPGMFNDDKYAKHPRPYWEIWLRIGSRTESRNWVPTHWMPLPPPPGAEPAKGE